jgi:hypothetical protein
MELLFLIQIPSPTANNNNMVNCISTAGAQPIVSPKTMGGILGNPDQNPWVKAGCFQSRW